MNEFERTDPRRPGGDISGPGGPYDEDSVIIDTHDAVLLDGINSAIVGRLPASPDEEVFIAMRLEGRINKTSERAAILFLFNEDGSAAIITELLGISSRLGPAFRERMLERLKEMHW